VNLRRAGVAGVAVLAAVTMAVSGCGKSGNSGGNAGGASTGASASPTPDPKAVLAKSADALSTTPFAFTMSTDDGTTGSGTTDPVGHKAHVAIKGTANGTAMTMDMIMVGKDVWLKMDLGAAANKALGIVSGKYMHIDTTKVKNSAALGLNMADSDPAESAKLMQGLVDAQQIDATHYRATIDVTKAENSAVSQDSLDKLGDKAKAVPATITLDSQGRLSEVDLDLSMVKPGTAVKVTYSNYGAAVTIAAPAKASTVEAPQNVYKMFDQ
jgi:hypothetical protein